PGVRRAVARPAARARLPGEGVDELAADRGRWRVRRQCAGRGPGGGVPPVRRVGHRQVRRGGVVGRAVHGRTGAHRRAGVDRVPPRAHPRWRRPHHRRRARARHADARRAAAALLPRRVRPLRGLTRHFSPHFSQGGAPLMPPTLGRTSPSVVYSPYMGTVSELDALRQTGLLRSGADVAMSREEGRRRRIRRLGAALAAVSAVLWARILTGHPVHLGLPHLPPGAGPYIPGVILIIILTAVLVLPMMGMSRSPHVLYRPGEIGVRLDDVKGAGVVVEEVVKSLNLFLAHKTFREQMGGTPRRAILFEGPPGTGKTYLAKAMAAEAGVPFLYVSSTAFQSHFYGATARKLRSYFKALRKAARAEGGAIGFIEEIDAIGAARSGMGAATGREGITGVVNELLIQLQSFDTPAPGARARGLVIDAINWWLPAKRRIRKREPKAANVLVIGATNRAADLDPALLRPGRFDRSITFDLPSRAV